MAQRLPCTAAYVVTLKIAEENYLQVKAVKQHALFDLDNVQRLMQPIRQCTCSTPTKDVRENTKSHQTMAWLKLQVL